MTMHHHHHHHLMAPDGAPAGSLGGAPAEGGAAPVAGAPAAAPGGAGAAPAARRTTTADLPPEALAAKLRATRAQTEQETRAKVYADLGIDDPEKYKAQREEEKKRLADYERSAEETKRASMTENEQLKADNARLAARVAELEGQLASKGAEVQAAKFEGVVREAVAAHIDPMMQDDAVEALHRHMRALPKEQLRKFGRAEASAFYAKLAKDKPPYAKKPAAGAPPAKPAPARRPLTNGVPPAAAAPSGKVTQPNGKKSAKDMSRAELKDAWSKFGARAPG